MDTSLDWFRQLYLTSPQFRAAMDAQAKKRQIQSIPNPNLRPQSPNAYNGPATQLGPSQQQQTQAPTTLDLLREAKAPRTRISRDVGGRIIDPNAAGGLDAFRLMNPNRQSLEEEAAETRARQRAAGQSAINERRNFQQGFSIPDPNRVETSPDGTRIAYKNGMPIGSNTKPMNVATQGGVPIGGFTPSERGFFGQEAGRVYGQTQDAPTQRVSTVIPQVDNGITFGSQGAFQQRESGMMNPATGEPMMTNVPGEFVGPMLPQTTSGWGMGSPIDALGGFFGALPQIIPGYSYGFMQGQQ